MLKKLWCALLLSPCSFKCAQNPLSDSTASLLKGVELCSDHDGYGNFSSGDGTTDEENLRFDMTYGAVLKIYWFVGLGDCWAVFEDQALRLSWSVTAGCCMWGDAPSACKLNSVIWKSVSSNRWQTPLCLFLSHFAVPSDSETTPKSVTLSLPSLFLIALICLERCWAMQVQCDL